MSNLDFSVRTIAAVSINTKILSTLYNISSIWPGIILLYCTN